jgi:hypothetical protein
MSVKRVSAILGLILSLILFGKYVLSFDKTYVKVENYKVDKIRNELRWLRYEKENMEKRYDCLYNTPKCLQVMPVDVKKIYKQYIDDEDYLLDILKEMEGS